MDLEKHDALLLFGLWAMLAIGAGLLGEKELMRSLAETESGAVAMYLRGKIA